MKRAKRASWSTLPEECGERVLSFLPVPALFRCRSVCKEWNELVGKPSFRHVCDLNGKNKRYLFVTHHLAFNGPRSFGDGWSWIDRSHLDNFTCFLDLDEQRWYSMPVDASVRASTDDECFSPRRLAMNDGLICEVSQPDYGGLEYIVVIFDPVANIRRELPADGRIRHFESEYTTYEPPVVVPVVDDHESRSFKVFSLDRNSILMNKRSGFFLYESSTNAWRALENPPLELGCKPGQMPGRTIEKSAVFFQGNLYVPCQYYSSSARIVVLSYNLEENLWREVYAVKSNNPGYPQLVVSGSRLFLAAWVDAPRPEGLDFPDCMMSYSVLEIAEISVDKKWSKSILRISKEKLQEICGEYQVQNSIEFSLDDPETILKTLSTKSRSQIDISFGFPLDSNTLLLFTRSTGKLMVYDLSSGSVIRNLPGHPLCRLHRALLKREEEDLIGSEDGEISSHFSAQLMNLSLRNVLSGVPGSSHSQLTPLLRMWL